MIDDVKLLRPRLPAIRSRRDLRDVLFDARVHDTERVVFDRIHEYAPRRPCRTVREIVLASVPDRQLLLATAEQIILPRIIVRRLQIVCVDWIQSLLFALAGCTV